MIQNQARGVLGELTNMAPSSTLPLLAFVWAVFVVACSGALASAVFWSVAGF